MAKGNGTTRVNNSNSQNGTPVRGELPNTPSYQYGRNEIQAAQNEIEDLEYGIREIEAQKQELFDETDRLGREMELDPKNEEYYRNEIMDLDREIDRLDEQRHTYRIRIDRLKNQYNL